MRTIRPRRRPPLLRWTLAAALLLAAVPWAGAPALAAPAWRDTGLTFPESVAPVCFDATQPNVLLLSETYAGSLGPPGTYVLDPRTDTASRLSANLFDLCSETNGLLFLSDPATGTAIRFTRHDPTPRHLAHSPFYIASDGSLTAYALDQPAGTPGAHLLASADGGLTWQPRPDPPGGPITTVSVADADPQAVLVTTQHFDGPISTLRYTIAVSVDGGRTWEQRHAERIPATGFTGISASFLPGAIAPTGTVALWVGNGIPGSNAGSTLYISNDGARTFVVAGDQGISSSVQVLQTPAGLLRLRIPRDSGYTLTRSRDGGHTWEALALPPFHIPHPPSNYLLRVQAPAAPANLFLYDARGLGDPTDLWYSPDSGQSWQDLGPRPDALYVSPFVPLTVLRVDPATRRLYTLDLPDASRTLPAPVPATGTPGVRYFPETQHNLAGPIRAYWESHGGLAQFGYPRTEAFREVSPTDGQIYTVQYFERNRLEYHPEHAGTPYEVQLGLLGVQRTESYRAAQHGAFNYFADAHYPGGVYFPQTGHNLRNTFLAYWQTHGGLAIHGYPISEEFYEVSPTDGHTYVVQYFQRSRFEWHPENRGTPYEVLLGLLGNRLLEAQGWR